MILYKLPAYDPRTFPLEIPPWQMIVPAPLTWH
jgi:hypothetical protein